MRYIIDYENVGADGLTGIEKVTKEGNKVSLFYSVKNDRFPIDLLSYLTSDKCVPIEYFKATKTVPQNVDFRIGTYVGSLIGRNDSLIADGLFIISSDKGYQNVKDFWEEQGVKNIRLCPNIAHSLNCKVEKVEMLVEQMVTEPDMATIKVQEEEPVPVAEIVEEPTPVPYRERIKTLFDEQGIPKKNGKVNEIVYKAFDGCKTLGDYHFQLVNELTRELGEHCYKLTEEMFKEAHKNTYRGNFRKGKKQ